MLGKAEARALAYHRLRAARAARFPFPIEGRIPNFVGAEAAARRLRTLVAYQRARTLKVNPDSPQLPVRIMALRDRKTLFIPTPRLRGGFLRIRPEDVPAGKEREAVRLSSRGSYGHEVALTDLPDIDLVVTGCVAVAPDGARAGKGEGFGDLEYALLREMGHPAPPVVTTVHSAQIVPAIAVEAHDISVDYIVTPDQVIGTATPYPKPERIDWTAVDLQAMPVLGELRRLTWQEQTVPDVLRPGLAVVFVGLNPGRASAAAGHHFAGPNNHFWRLLHEAGLTPRRLVPGEDGALLDLGIGITNAVDRASHGEQDLTWDEFLAGAQFLRTKVAAHRPRLLAVLGKQAYRAYAGLTRSATVDWGLQPRETVAGVPEYLAANPSSRSTLPIAVRLGQFAEIRRLAGT